jgi:O-antigen/teichoic acid export membrane protein
MTSVMFDANFRSSGRYSYGNNLLTALRTLDWCVSVLLIAATRDVPTTFMTLLIYKVCITGAMLVFLQYDEKSISLQFASLTLSRIASLIGKAKGQLVLSASTAAATMGPQIVVSAVFGDNLSVIFNTYRTYMRLVAALVTILSSSSWPLLSQMYAEHRVKEMSNFMGRLISRSLAGAFFAGLSLLLVAGPAFGFLFHGKVHVYYDYMFITFLSVILNCGTSLQQSLYLATNLSSRYVMGALAITLAGLCMMFIVGKFSGFLTTLVIQVAFDFMTLIAMSYGVRVTLSSLGRMRRDDLACV